MSAATLPVLADSAACRIGVCTPVRHAATIGAWNGSASGSCATQTAAAVRRAGARRAHRDHRRRPARGPARPARARRRRAARSTTWRPGAWSRCPAGPTGPSPAVAVGRCGPGSASTGCCGTCGADDARPRLERARRPLPRLPRTRAVVLDAMAADADWCAVGAGPHRGAGAGRPADRRPGRARRPAPGPARRLGAPRRRARRRRPASSGPPSWPGASRCAPSTPSTSPPPTGCPGRSPTSPSTTTRSRWPWPSASTSSPPDPRARLARSLREPPQRSRRAQAAAAGRLATRADWRHDAPLRRRPDRDPQARRRPLRQQRVRAALQGHRRRRPARRRQRAREAARAGPAPRRAPHPRDPRPLGPHPGRPGQMREAGYEVGVTELDAPRLEGRRLRRVPRADAEVIEVGRPGCTTIHTPGPHRGLDLLQGRGLARPVQRRHPVPRRPGQHLVRGWRLPHDHPVDRASACSPCPATRIVLPGHGDDTTIGTERPHLQEWIDRGW